MSEDDGLNSFNKMMMMETFALADNDWQSRLRIDLNPYKVYKTRLVRVDLARRLGSRDVLRHCLRKSLRAFWVFFRSGGTNTKRQESYSSTSELEAAFKGLIEIQRISPK